MLSIFVHCSGPEICLKQTDELFFLFAMNKFRRWTKEQEKSKSNEFEYVIERIENSWKSFFLYRTIRSVFFSLVHRRNLFMVDENKN